MLERIPVTNSDYTYLPGFIVTPEIYAHVLFLLTADSQGYVAAVRWQKGFGRRRKEYADVCGVETPLAKRTDDGNYELLIPHYDTLQSVFLIVFYRDGSILRTDLGTGDRAIIVRHAANGEADEARDRFHQAWRALQARKMHPDLRFSIGSVVGLAFFFLVFLSLRAWLASALTVLVALIAAIPMFQRNQGFLRPRRSRIGATWTSIGLTPEDRRKVLVHVSSLVIFGILAFLFGRLIPAH